MLRLPIATWTLAPRSVRYSSLPAFDSVTAFAMSNVTVPVLGFGIFPRGPRMRPSLPTFPIWSGVAIATSKSSKPSSICFARSALPTTSAPASCASFALSPSAKTATRVAAGAVREHQRAAELLVRVADVEPEVEVPRRSRRTCAPGQAFSIRTACTGLYSSLVRSISARALARRRLAVLAADADRRHVHAHRAGGARDDLRRSVQVACVQVRHLRLGDLADLVAGQPADLLGSARRALLEPKRFLDQDGGRRRPVMKSNDRSS